MKAPDGTVYDLIGPVDAPAIALIHGLGTCRHLWLSHLPALTTRYRVLNYDLYGHGDSPPPPAEASLTVYADQLAKLMDHVGIESAAIVGFSIGGMINRRFAMDHAQKASALAILNSPHDRGEAAQKLVEDRAKSVREQGALSTMEAALDRWFTPEYRSGNARVQQLFRDWRVMADPESYAQAAWVLANGVRELTIPNSGIESPTLVMTCENDTGSTPAMSSAIAAQIDGAETLILPRLQHLGLTEEPEAFTAPILEFLDRTIR